MRIPMVFTIRHLRQAFGRGSPRGLQGRRFGLGALEIALGMFIERAWVATTRLWPISRLLPCVARTYSPGQVIE
jgi:hypothetical protein